jgi:hypothetical protein
MGIVKKHNSNEGQFTFVNILAMFVAIVVLLLFMPVLSNLIETTASNLGVANEYTPLVQTLLYIIPGALILGLIITIINYANPPQGYM